jgi:hypothetical protein
LRDEAALWVCLAQTQAQSDITPLDAGAEFWRWSEAAMDVRISVDSLNYDLIRGKVMVVLSGEIGGREVRIELQFPFRGTHDQPENKLREIALLEAQQILRAAATVTLPQL